MTPQEEDALKKRLSVLERENAELPKLKKRLDDQEKARKNEQSKLLDQIKKLMVAVENGRRKVSLLSQNLTELQSDVSKMKKGR